MPPKLTTHILDTHSGTPAANVSIELFSGGTKITEATTNADGRCDAPLLEGDQFAPGSYEIVFHIGDYFRAQGIESPFLDSVPVRFHTTAGASYHVPLVCTPWSYSTYRGS